ncbi:MAG: hypothetical protein PHV74_00255 [Dehalococcoidia bacterium]|nr:hypothetical protein [Dehalococcoidia bacterium]
MGDDRTLEKVREALGRHATYNRQIEEWSSRWKWQERIAAYEAHLDKARLEANRQAVIEMAERQAKEGKMLQTLGTQKINTLLQSLVKLQEQQKKSGTEASDTMVLPKVTVSEAIRALEVGAKLERVARGEPNEIMKQNVESDMVDVAEDVMERIAKALEMKAQQQERVAAAREKYSEWVGEGGVPQCPK